MCCIMFHVLPLLYIKVEMDLGKFSFSTGNKEKYEFVVSVFAMKLSLNMQLLQDEYSYSCSIPKHSSFLFPSLDKKHICKLLLQAEVLKQNIPK